MKNLFTLTFIIAHTIFSFGQTNKEDKIEAKQIAKARVRSVTQTFHEYVLDLQTGTLIPAAKGVKIVSKQYDSLGNAKEQIDYDDYGITVSKSKFKYSKGNMSEQALYTSSGALTQRNTFKYDSHGSLIEMLTYDEHNKLDHVNPIKPTYDKKGNLILTIAEDTEGNELTKEEMQYDDGGRCIEDLLYEYGRLVSREVYHYDNLGLMDEYEWHGGNNDLSDRREVYTRNESGRITKVKLYDANSLPYRTDLYKMNSKGLITEVQRIDNTSGTDKYQGVYKYVYTFY